MRVSFFSRFVNSDSVYSPSTVGVLLRVGIMHLLLQINNMNCSLFFLLLLCCASSYISLVWTLFVWLHKGRPLIEPSFKQYQRRILSVGYRLYVFYIV